MLFFSCWGIFFVLPSWTFLCRVFFFRLLMVPGSEQKRCAGQFLLSSSSCLTLYSLLLSLRLSSLVLTCSLFSFSLSHCVSASGSLPIGLLPHIHHVFRTPRRLPPDYAWVGLNDYIKPRTKSTASRWDLMRRRGEGSDGGGLQGGRGGR